VIRSCWNVLCLSFHTFNFFNTISKRVIFNSNLLELLLRRFRTLIVLFRSHWLSLSFLHRQPRACFNLFSLTINYFCSIFRSWVYVPRSFYKQITLFTKLVCYKCYFFIFLLRFFSNFTSMRVYRSFFITFG